MLQWNADGAQTKMGFVRLYLDQCFCGLHVCDILAQHLRGFRFITERADVMTLSGAKIPEPTGIEYTLATNWSSTVGMIIAAEACHFYSPDWSPSAQDRPEFKFSPKRLSSGPELTSAAKISVSDRPGKSAKCMPFSGTPNSHATPGELQQFL